MPTYRYVSNVRPKTADFPLKKSAPQQINQRIPMLAELPLKIAEVFPTAFFAVSQVW
jgi:hypothetical protein